MIFIQFKSSLTIFHPKLLIREGRVWAMDERIHHPWQYLSRRSLWEVKWASGFSWGHITYYNMTAFNCPWPDRTATCSLSLSFIFYFNIYITMEWGEVIIMIWWLPIVHDQIEWPPILYILSSILYILYVIFICLLNVRSHAMHKLKSHFNNW